MCRGAFYYMKKLLKSDFYRSVLTLFTGTALSQIIPVLASLVLVRLYTEYDYGVLEMFLKIQAFLVFLSTLRYDMAVPLPKSDKHAFILLNFSFRFNLYFLMACQVLAIFLFVLNDFLGWGIPQSWIYLFLPITVFFLSLNGQFDNWFTRKKWYKNITISRVVSAITNNGVKIGLGFLNFSFVGLILGNIVSAFAGAAAFFGKFRKSKEEYKSYKSKRSQGVLLKKYKDFPLITLPHSISDMTRELVFVALTAHFYGWELGAYALTLKLMRAPIAFMGSAVGQVYFQKVSNHVANNEGIFAITKKTTLQLFALSIIPFSVLALFSVEIFTFVLGEDWRESGEFAQILTPWMFVQFVSSPLSKIPAVLGKQKQFFGISIIASLVMVLTIWIGGRFYADWSFEFVLLWISIGQLIMLLIIVFWIWNLTKKFDKNLIEGRN